MADAHAKHHDYHIIDPSPWPFLGSLGALVMSIGGIAWMKALNGTDFTIFGFDLAASNYWLFLIGLFIVLRILTHRYHKLQTPGFVAGAFAAGYGVFRTLVEFFREPDFHIGYLAGGLTMGMLLSVPMIVAGIALMVWASRRKPASRPAGE